MTGRTGTKKALALGGSGVVGAGLLPLLFVIPASAVGQHSIETVDSTVVQGAHPRLPPGSWTIDPNPEIEIGSATGSIDYALYNVRSGFVLSDGTIVVANNVAGRNDVRFFDRNGRHLRTVETFGQGPGEFRTLGRIIPLPYDSVLLVGEPGWRHSVLDPRGQRVHEGVAVSESFFRFAESGYVESRKVVAIRVTGPPGYPDGEQQQVTWVGIVDLLSGASDTVSVTESRRVFVNGQYRHFQPFTPFVLVATGAGGIWVARSDLPEVHRFSSTGVLGLSIGLDWGGERVTRRMREQYSEDYINAVPVLREELTRFVRQDAVFPRRLPVIRDLKVDRGGNLWILRFQSPWSTEEDQRWEVFDSDGDWVTTIEIPHSVFDRESCSRSVGECSQILDIGNDYLLIKTWDSLETALVRRHAIVKKP